MFAAVPGADLRWLSVFFAEGGLNAVDGLVLDVSRWPAAPEGLERVVQDVAAMAAELGYAPSLWVWRFGYPTHTGLSASEPRRAGVSPDEQAAFVVRAQHNMASAGVTTVLWDELVDRGRDGGDADQLGLYEEVGRGKAATFAYATMTRMLTGMRYAAPDDLPTLPTTWGDEIVEVPMTRLAWPGLFRSTPRRSSPRRREPGCTFTRITSPGTGDTCWSCGRVID